MVVNRQVVGVDLHLRTFVHVASFFFPLFLHLEDLHLVQKMLNERDQPQLMRDHTSLDAALLLKLCCVLLLC